MFRASIVSAVLVMCSAAYAQNIPFGLRMGMTLQEVEKLTKLEKRRDFFYTAAKLPEGHSQLDDYRLVITPEHGLCKVIGWNSSIDTSVFGNELRAEFDNFEQALTERYKKGKKYNFLNSGSIWDEPRDWMMALQKKERVLATIWTSSTGSSLPPHIHTIKLEVFAPTTTQGMLSIAYEFKNFPECDKVISGKRDSKL